MEGFPCCILKMFFSVINIICFVGCCENVDVAAVRSLLGLRLIDSCRVAKAALLIKDGEGANYATN